MGCSSFVETFFRWRGKLCFCCEQLLCIGYCGKMMKKKLLAITELFNTAVNDFIALVLFIWTSGRVCPGFVWSLTSSPVCDGFLRFISECHCCRPHGSLFRRSDEDSTFCHRGLWFIMNMLVLIYYSICLHVDRWIPDDTCQLHTYCLRVPSHGRRAMFLPNEVHVISKGTTYHIGRFRTCSAQ